MKFDFFTFGGRFFWEDVFNYQNWVIQRHIRTKKYRLLDNYSIRRGSGSFEDCKNTLLKYIDAYELESPYSDSVILLHNFGRTKFSMKRIAESLKDLKANIIAFNYPFLHKNLNYQADLLCSFIKNLNTQGKLHFITNGAGCLLLRRFLSQVDDYRAYHIAGVLDINPLNSGSDLADLLCRSNFLRKILGPMLIYITPKKALELPKLPKEIKHSLLFYPPVYTQLIKKILSRYESFPFQTPPSESSYADDVQTINAPRFFPLNAPELGKICRYFVCNDKLPQASAAEKK